MRVCLAGATGWAGSELSRSIIRSNDIALVAGVSRRHAGQDLGEVLGLGALNIPLFGDISSALAVDSDILFEYTKPDSGKSNVLKALEGGRNVIIGTSGLTTTDYAEIEAMALKLNRSVLAVGNFAMTVVLLEKFAEMAAKYLDHWEILDFAHADKIDAPSGTARELAEKLSHIKESKKDIALDKIRGAVESRGADLQGTQVHSIRLPGYVIGIEAHFGKDDERLVLRHESGSSARPYVDGAMLAIRNLAKVRGLQRGLDKILDL
jgi:4-hydroxy-tetrahydrodipicolinate reductase